jgi:hypothetical protein
MPEKKIWMPPIGRDRMLDLYIELVKEYIIQEITTNNKSNISTEERKGLRDLLNDESIVSRPADTSSGIVVMDKEDYVNNVNEDLNNNSTYKKMGWMVQLQYPTRLRSWLKHV